MDYLKYLTIDHTIPENAQLYSTDIRLDDLGDSYVEVPQAIHDKSKYELGQYARQQFDRNARGETTVTYNCGYKNFFDAHYDPEFVTSDDFEIACDISSERGVFSEKTLAFLCDPIKQPRNNDKPFKIASRKLRNQMLPKFSWVKCPPKIIKKKEYIQSRLSNIRVSYYDIACNISECFEPAPVVVNPDKSDIALMQNNSKTKFIIAIVNDTVDSGYVDYISKIAFEFHLPIVRSDLENFFHVDYPLLFLSSGDLLANRTLPSEIKYFAFEINPFALYEPIGKVLSVHNKTQKAASFYMLTKNFVTVDYEYSRVDRYYAKDIEHHIGRPLGNNFYNILTSYDLRIPCSRERVDSIRDVQFLGKATGYHAVQSHLHKLPMAIDHYIRGHVINDKRLQKRKRRPYFIRSRDDIQYGTEVYSSSKGIVRFKDSVAIGEHTIFCYSQHGDLYREVEISKILIDGRYYALVNPRELISLFFVKNPSAFKDHVRTRIIDVAKARGTEFTNSVDPQGIPVNILQAIRAAPLGEDTTRVSAIHMPYDLTDLSSKHKQGKLIVRWRYTNIADYRKGTIICTLEYQHNCTITYYRVAGNKFLSRTVIYDKDDLHDLGTILKREVENMYAADLVTCPD
jgi:hypothetical protein